MPCNSDYLEASTKEIRIGQVACLLEELDGKPINREYWKGYHPAVYGQDLTTLGDRLVSMLCEKLQSRDITKQSLEMQMWWRDHQAADKARLEQDIAITNAENERLAVLEKLTPSERRLLGF